MSEKTPKLFASDFRTDAKAEFTMSHQTGWVPFVIRKKLTVSAAANAVIAAVPANTVIDTAALKARDVGADPIATGTHLGIGITDALAKFVEVAEASVDNNDLYVDADIIEDPVLQATAANLLLASTNGSGAAAGSFTGTWDILITGRTFTGIGD